MGRIMSEVCFNRVVAWIAVYHVVDDRWMKWVALFGAVFALVRSVAAWTEGE